jgi:hypothetical protein
MTPVDSNKPLVSIKKARNLLAYCESNLNNCSREFVISNIVETPSLNNIPVILTFKFAPVCEFKCIKKADLNFHLQFERHLKMCSYGRHMFESH